MIGRSARLAPARRYRRIGFGALIVALVAASGGVAAWRAGVWREPAAPPPRRDPSAVPTTPPAGEEPTAASPEPFPSPEPINGTFEGLTTFRGNATRTYYGEGPVPSDPQVLWRFPPTGGMCSQSVDAEGPRTWCGTGWTGQPNVVEPADGPVQVLFGAYDRGVHVVHGRTGRELMEPFITGDIIKGTVTSDPDGFPLLYTGSRDNHLRILALDRGSRPVELWRLPADSAPSPLWNDDWDGSPLVIDDHLLEGGENSWFYVVKLNREYDDAGKVTVDPRIRMMVPGFDDRLLADLGDQQVSIESSVAFDQERGVAYFANSGGLVQGWHIADVLNGGDGYRRVFRFWAGEDIDASVVVDEEGFLYVAAEQERFNARGQQVGQLLKLDPWRGHDPVVWSVDVAGGGMWATPALHRNAVLAATNSGRILAVGRDGGRVRWELQLAPPTWASPVIVDGVMVVADCSGTLRGYRLRPNPLAGRPRPLWSVQLEGCIESTPAVWKGMVYVGARGGAVYGIGDG